MDFPTNTKNFMLNPILKPLTYSISFHSHSYSHSHSHSHSHARTWLWLISSSFLLLSLCFQTTRETLKCEIVRLQGHLLSQLHLLQASNILIGSLLVPFGKFSLSNSFPYLKSIYRSFNLVM